MTLRLVLRIACWALSAFVTSMSQVSATPASAAVTLAKMVSSHPR